MLLCKAIKIYNIASDKKIAQVIKPHKKRVWDSLRASSPIWASETGLARTRERAAPRSRVLARLASLAKIGELARRLCLG